MVLIAMHAFLEQRHGDDHKDWLALQNRVSDLSWIGMKLYHAQFATSDCKMFLINHSILAFGGEFMHKCSYVYKILAPALLNEIIRFTWSDCSRHCWVISVVPNDLLSNKQQSISNRNAGCTKMGTPWYCLHMHIHLHTGPLPWIFPRAPCRIKGLPEISRVTLAGMHTQRKPTHKGTVRHRYSIVNFYNIQSKNIPP